MRRIKYTRDGSGVLAVRICDVCYKQSDRDLAVVKEESIASARLEGNVLYIGNKTGVNIRRDLCPEHLTELWRLLDPERAK